MLVQAKSESVQWIQGLEKLGHPKSKPQSFGAIVIKAVASEQSWFQLEATIASE